MGIVVSFAASMTSSPHAMTKMAMSTCLDHQPVNQAQLELGETVTVQLAMAMADIAGMPMDAKMHHHSGGRSIRFRSLHRAILLPLEPRVAKLAVNSG